LLKEDEDEEEEKVEAVAAAVLSPEQLAREEEALEEVPEVARN
jgi:hypothetical protein